jgi:hypothetical protein
MKLTSALLPTFVVAGAGTLASSYFSESLRHTEPYAALAEVRWPVAVLLFTAYLIALTVACMLLVWAVRSGSVLKRSLLAGSWLLVFWVAAVFAPGIPYAGLALACVSPTLCPDAANPIAWALSGVVRS